MSKAHPLGYNEILNVFHYFDFFKHALSAYEVWKYCELTSTNKQVEDLLGKMVTDKLLVAKKGFYALANKKANIESRLEHLPLNQNLLVKAKWVARLLKLIPFVKGIGISGSLSKHGATPESDIDFFLITAKNRVWLVKSFAIALKKILFLGSHKYLCVNYLLAENELELKKKNRFQAMEAVTIIPLYGPNVFRSFIDSNKWIKAYFPNVFPPNFSSLKETKTLTSKLLEFLFKGRVGNKIEQVAMRSFRKYGINKFRNARGFKGKVKYEKGESAYFPTDFESAVLKNYELKTNTLAH